MKKLRSEIIASLDHSSQRMSVLYPPLTLDEFQAGIDTKLRSKIQELRLEKLIGLLKRKVMIEANLAKSAQTLEKAFIAASRELHAALEGRMEETWKRSDTTRKEIQH